MDKIMLSVRYENGQRFVVQKKVKEEIKEKEIIEKIEKPTAI